MCSNMACDTYSTESKILGPFKGCVVEGLNGYKNRMRVVFYNYINFIFRII